MQIPATGFAYWLFQALATEAGGTLANADGTETDFASPASIEALRYWIDLAAKYQAHPPGVVDWGTTPRDFLEQKVAMIWTTTGNLSNIRANAKFPFGVGMLPADKRRGSPTGGGNFYLFKTASAAAACGSAALSALDQQSGAGRAVGHRHRLCGDQSRRVGDAGNAKVRRRLSCRPRWHAINCSTPSPSCRRTTTSR